MLLVTNGCATRRAAVPATDEVEPPPPRRVQRRLPATNSMRRKDETVDTTIARMGHNSTTTLGGLLTELAGRNNVER